MTELIGNTQLVLDYYNGRDQYSDGPIEEDNLNIVHTQSDHEETVSADDRWPVYYHLSPKCREYIIQPMDIKSSRSVAGGVNESTVL